MIVRNEVGRGDELRTGSRSQPTRVVAAEVTLERLLPLLPRMGITRVGNLTGLDRVGIPVAMAVRPNSRAVAVSQGKGISVPAAKVSAIMEAAESFHAESITGPLRRASADELGDAVDPSRLPLAAGTAPPRDLRRHRCLWIAGTDLMSGDTRSIPFELVHSDYTDRPPEPATFQATTNGLGAGNVPEEAQVHALCEVIERDAIACWREAGGPGNANGRPVDLADAPDDDVTLLLDRFASADCRVTAWECTSDIGVPVIVVLVAPRARERSAIEPELGYGCHPDPSLALLRALTEAAQTRLTRISGARDDFEPLSYQSEARRRRRVEAEQWFALASRGRVAWQKIIDRFRPEPASDPCGTLAVLLSGLQRAGLDEAVWVDLTRPEIGIPVGRMIVPGLEGPWLPGLYQPGARARGRRR